MSTDAEIIELSDRGVVTLQGPEVLNFLQDLVTADVTAATKSRAAYGLLLTPQGKFLFDFFILRDGNIWILECERDRSDELVKRLTMYRLRKKIEISNESEQHKVLAVMSGDVPEDAAYSYPDPRHDDLARRAIVGDSFESAVGAEAQYERLRLELGVPKAGTDLLPDTTFPLEANLDALHAIDFDKGCYVGQEVTSRTKHRGNVRKRLLPVSFGEPGVQAGDDVMANDRNGGTVTSAQDDIGLAMIRLERWRDCDQLLAGDVGVVPRIPDWLQKAMEA